jgi:hypothetical protein
VDHFIASIEILCGLDIGLLVLPLRLEALVVVPKVVKYGALVGISKNLISLRDFLLAEVRD